MASFPWLRRLHGLRQLHHICSILRILGVKKGSKSFSSLQDDAQAARCLLLRQDRCLLLRQDRCLLLRQDRCLLVRQGAALSHQFTSVLSQQKTSVLSQQQTSVLSQQQTSVLSQQKTFGCFGVILGRSKMILTPFLHQKCAKWNKFGGAGGAHGATETTPWAATRRGLGLREFSKKTPSNDLEPDGAAGQCHPRYWLGP